MGHDDGTDTLAYKLGQLMALVIAGALFIAVLIGLYKLLSWLLGI